MTADTPQKLGKYEIRGTLGRGAMGIVYDGFDPIIERRVAIKTIVKSSLDPSEAAELLGRFKREAQAAGRLNHPGIVSIHDYGEDDGLAYIAMEYIQGNDLRRYFQLGQRFELRHIVRIMCDMLDALDHAHRNGVVHRDIKPANIMITDEGRVKVADFGVAWIESSTMTQVGARIGTPAYMSPEQHQGLPVSGRSDLFSAGVILYQFLTGERPFSGSGYPLIRQILLEDPVPPSQRNPDIPRALDAVTLKALAKRPEDRFATARQFAEAFRQAATGESAAAGADSLLGAIAALDGPADVPRLASSLGTTAVANASNDGGSNSAAVSLEAELEYWREIKDSTDAADFETFLRVFPASRFAPLARRRLSRLQAESGPKPEGAQAQPEAAGPQRKRRLRALRRRKGGDTGWRSEAKEPKLPPLLGAPDAAIPAIDMSPSLAMAPVPPAAEPALPAGADEPIHARLALEPTEVPAEMPAIPVAPQPTASARKRRAMPNAWLLTALLLAVATLYATQPELGPKLATLASKAQAKLEQTGPEAFAEQQPRPQAAEQVQQPRKLREAQRDQREAARLAEAQRKKEQAARAADEAYEFAVTLLAHGRSSEAVRQLRQLAHGGHGPAAKLLGDLYSTGEEVLLDMQEAAYFYAMAERNGVKIERSAYARSLAGERDRPPQDTSFSR